VSFRPKRSEVEKPAVLTHRATVISIEAHRSVSFRPKRSEVENLLFSPTAPLSLRPQHSEVCYFDRSGETCCFLNPQGSQLNTAQAIANSRRPPSPHKKWPNHCRAEGPRYPSLGQRPRYRTPTNPAG